MGVKKAEGHVGGERGTRQHLQSPLLIALLPAWSQITGLERLQSGLYLLANLSPPQIRTSKPPSYHLLVNLQQWKGHRGTVKLNSFSASLFLCVENALGGSYTHHGFFWAWKGSGQVFISILPLSGSFDVKSGVTNPGPFTNRDQPLTWLLAQTHLANDSRYFN